MSRAKKMRLISDEEYQTLIKSGAPPSHAFEIEQHNQQQQMKREVEKSLETPPSYEHLGDDQKWKLYQQALHRLLDVSSMLDKKAIKVEFDSDLPDVSTKLQRSLAVASNHEDRTNKA